MRPGPCATSAAESAPGCEFWKNNGVDEICGLDGDYVDRSLLMIDESQFHCHDLRDKLPVTKNFDLALSLEVAEHLPQDRAESFVAELTAIAPVILFSAAIPNQGGTDHVNEQWQDYWAELFMKRGFKAHDVIRPAVWNNDHVERWYRQNMILYCREDKVANYPALSSAKTLPLSIVHPKQYAGRSEEYTVFETLVLLKGSLRRAAERRLQRLTGKYRPTNAKEVGF